MWDLSRERVCDHKIFEEQLTLRGSSPNYFAVLNFICNKNTNAMDIREWSETNGLTNYDYTISGMTNWTLSNDGRQINFNSLGLGGPGSGAASFVDGCTLIQPIKMYVASYYALDTSCPLHDLPGEQFAPIQKDVNINPQGRLVTLQGKEKVRQSVLKALLTSLGGNTFHTTYGSSLQSIIGQKFDMFAQMSIQQSVQEAVDFLIQQQQLSTFIPTDELIFRVSAVDISTDETDPRVVRVNVRVLTGTYEEVEISIGLSL